MSNGDVPGNPAGFIVGSVNEGLSATAALGEFRDAGGAIRTQTWYQLYGEVSATLARSGDVGGLDPNVLPDPALYSTWSMGAGGQYVTDVDVYVRDTGSGVLGSLRYTYTTDYPHTPGEAQQAAMDDYGDDDNTGTSGSGEGQVIMGASTANIYQTIAYRR